MPQYMRARYFPGTSHHRRPRFKVVIIKGNQPHLGDTYSYHAEFSQRDVHKVFAAQGWTLMFDDPNGWAYFTKPDVNKGDLGAT